MSDSVRRLFDEVPGRYELVNCLITFCLDRRWRRLTAERAAAAGGEQWIDVCTGTGDMVYNLLRLAPEWVRLYASDFCVPMLNKARNKPGGSDIRFVEADTRSLPFPDDSFDLVTMSFATRNINTTRENLKRNLRECRRILKQGGRFFQLETTQPVSPVIRFFFHLYVKNYVRLVGGLLSSPAAYRYLAYTIPRFDTAEGFRDILVEVGFSQVRFERLFLGVAAIHEATK